MKYAMFCLTAILAAGMLCGADEVLSRKVEPEDEIPALKGVAQAGLRDSKWGFAAAVTEYRDAATGKVAGKVGVGSVFLVEKYQKADRGYDFVVRFRSRPKEGPFLVHTSKIYGLTGSFEMLSEHQQKVFAAYYRRRAECDKIRFDLNKKNGELSPYYKDAIEAQKKFDSQVEEVHKLEAKLMNSNAGGDDKIRERLTQMKGEMSVQRAKLTELSAKHRDWKKAHASQLADPEKDPKYKAYREEMDDYAKIIPGLAI